MNGNFPVLKAAIGAYPHTAAIISGAIAPRSFRFDFADIPTINRAFAPMVRELRFDVSEMAIATYLQAKAYGKKLVLLPIVMAARFQEQALLCRADSDIKAPADLAGRRVGVRAYSQTTGLWLRGELEDEYGISPDRIAWVTFEGAHVPEFVDPPWVTRAAAGKDLMTMLRDGEVDAVIVGNDMPDDPGLRCVFADPQAAADKFLARHGVVPVNHMIVVTETLIEEAPAAVDEIMRLFAAAKDQSPKPAGARDPRPLGRTAVEPAVALALRYATAQGFLPRPLTMGEVWAGTPD